MNGGHNWDPLPYSVGDLVYIFKYGRHTTRHVGIITKAQWPPPGSLQIPEIEALVEGEIMKIGFEEIRKVEDCHDDGQNENVLNSPIEDQIRTHIPVAGDIARLIEDFPERYDSATMLILRTLKGHEMEAEHVARGWETPALYAHPYWGVGWIDDIAEESTVALVLHPEAGLVWMPMVWLEGIS